MGQQLFADETELNLPMIVDGKLLYWDRNCSNPRFFVVNHFLGLTSQEKIKVGLPEAPICDLTPVPLESVELPLILGRGRSTFQQSWKKHPEFCIFALLARGDISSHLFITIGFSSGENTIFPSSPCTSTLIYGTFS